MTVQDVSVLKALQLNETSRDRQGKTAQREAGLRRLRRGPRSFFSPTDVSSRFAGSKTSARNGASVSENARNRFAFNRNASLKTSPIQKKEFRSNAFKCFVKSIKASMALSSHTRSGTEKKK